MVTEYQGAVLRLVVPGPVRPKNTLGGEGFIWRAIVDATATQVYEVTLSNIVWISSRYSALSPHITYV